MAATRCGHTNMYNYFGIEPYTETGVTFRNWKLHYNSIIVLRNPLDRVASAASKVWVKMSLITHAQDNTALFVRHSLPYMKLIGSDFRIIDFYDLEQYIPRNGDQSWRANSRVNDAAKAEDVYIENDAYTLQELEQEVKIYNKLMVTQERVSVEEWKELTRYNNNE
jgi:hypothetical protein